MAGSWRSAPGTTRLRKQRELVSDLVYFHGLTIAERLPPGLLKRRPGYAIDRCVREPNNLNHLLCGSEGTLAAITSAELKIVPLPKQKGLALIFFASVAEAMQATVELLDLKPAAIEHLDRVLLDQTRGQREFQAARDLLELEFKPCQSILAVEFFDEVDGPLAALAKRKLGLRKTILKTPGRGEPDLGAAQGGAFAADRPQGRRQAHDRHRGCRRAPEGLARLRRRRCNRSWRRWGCRPRIYGHAAAGLLHVRPILDLHSAEDLKKFRQLANEVSALVAGFKGSLAGEHGVGIARTRIHGRAARRRPAGRDARDQSLVRPAQPFQSGQGCPGWALHRLTRICARGRATS